MGVVHENKKRFFLDEAFKKLQANQENFLQTYHIDSYTEWFCDDPSGVFTLCKDDDELFLEYQVIGTYSNTGIWQWAWSNNSLYPTIKQASLEVKKFGKKHKFKELSKSCWQANEAQAWEMLAFANHVLEPLGVYRMELDDLTVFVVFTEKISKVEAIHLKENSCMLTHCKTHGLKRPAYVCKHLLEEPMIGFHEPFETDRGMELHHHEELQAWCNACEENRLEYTDDGYDEWELLMNTQTVCEDCFFEIKERNSN